MEVKVDQDKKKMENKVNSDLKTDKDLEEEWRKKHDKVKKKSSVDKLPKNPN